MKSTAVVFRGTAQVLDAYVANDVPTWALVIGNDVFCAYEGVDIEEGKGLLAEALKRLKEGNSRATMDLRVYKLKDGQDILSNTPHLRAFRFALFNESDLSPFDYGQQTARAQYEARFEEMNREIQELKLALTKAEEEPEETPSTVNAMISGILENPAVKQALSMRLIGLIDKIIPMNPAGRPAAIAGIEGQGGIRSLLDEGQQMKVQQAINILCQKDAQLGDHLLGVANIAVTNPAQYTMIVGMLK
jgi:hypothetical protein